MLCIRYLLPCSRCLQFTINTYDLTQFFWVKDLVASQLGGSGSEFLLGLWSRCQSRLRSSEGLVRAGGSFSKWHAHVAAKLVLAVGGTPWFFPSGWTIHRDAWVSSRHGGWLLPERVIWEQGGHPDAFYILISEFTSFHVSAVTWPAQCEGTTQRWEARTMGANLEALPHQIDALSSFAPCLGQNNSAQRNPGCGPQSRRSWLVFWSWSFLP